MVYELPSRGDAVGDDLRLGTVAPSLEVRCLTPLEVRRLVWEGVPLLDARTCREYQRCHLHHAIHLATPAPAQAKALNASLEPLPWETSLLRARFPDRRAPLICYSNAEGRSHQLVLRLQQLDYLHVYALAGGLNRFLAPQDA